jgi:hypothetical protein
LVRGKGQPQGTLASVDEEIQLDSSGEAFVDDSNLASPSSLPYHPHEVSRVDQRMHTASAIKNLQILAQRWERALFSTGGAINLSESFWFAFHWDWKGGKPSLVNPPPTQLRLTEGDELNRTGHVPYVRSLHFPFWRHQGVLRHLTSQSPRLPNQDSIFQTPSRGSYFFLQCIFTPQTRLSTSGPDPYRSSMLHAAVTHTVSPFTQTSTESTYS